MKRFCFPVVLVLACAVAVVAQQQARGPSTAEERARFVGIASRFEADPLDKNLQSDREWAFRWLVEVPDIAVTFCVDTLGDFYKAKPKYKYGAEVTLATLLGTGAFVIQNPEKAKDRHAVNLSGAESVLRVYKAILKKDPGATSKSLDALAAKQAAGQLAEEVRKNGANCK